MIVFFGTSPRSAKFLDLALTNGCKFDLVVSAPPKLVGRKQVLTENPTVVAAKMHQLPHLLYQEELAHQRNLKLGVILDFNKIIPNEIIELFEKGIINIHFSKLPQYRGPSPVQYTILNGDKQAWISYSLISQELDGGEIIKQTFLPLDLTENTETLYQKLLRKSSSEINYLLNAYLTKEIIPKPQEGKPSLTQRLKSSNCKIDWTRPATEIERLIRAAYPEPGAWTEVNLKTQMSNLKTLRLKILQAHLEDSKLIPDLVQLEGKNPVAYKQFKEGHPQATFS